MAVWFAPAPQWLLALNGEAPTPETALAYSYDIVGERIIVHAKGEIHLNEATNLNTWWSTLPVNAANHMRIGSITLALDSPGGSIEGAGHIMQWVKDNQVDTIVANGATCTSACVMVWGAGTHKTAGSTAQIGVHGASTTVASNDDEKAAIEALGTLTVARALAEEKAPAAVIAAVATTASSDMHWLTADEAAAWGSTVLDKDGNPES